MDLDNRVARLEDGRRRLVGDGDFVRGHEDDGFHRFGEGHGGGGHGGGMYRRVKEKGGWRGTGWDARV